MQYSEEEIDYRLKNYFKFMFVRHPLECQRSETDCMATTSMHGELSALRFWRTWLRVSLPVSPPAPDDRCVR